MGQCGFEWSFELGLYWSTVYRQDEFIPCDRAELGRSTCPWNFFFFRFGIPKSWCPQRNAMNRMGSKD